MIYNQRKSKVNTLRKGKYLSEIKEEIRQQEIHSKNRHETRIKEIETHLNIVFPDNISESEDISYEILK